MARGLYHRLGLTPSPEDLFYYYTTSMLLFFQYANQSLLNRVPFMVYFCFTKSICFFWQFVNRPYKTQYNMNSSCVSDTHTPKGYIECEAHIESYMTYREFTRIHIDDFKLSLKSLYHILCKSQYISTLYFRILGKIGFLEKDFLRMSHKPFC